MHNNTLGEQLIPRLHDEAGSTSWLDLLALVSSVSWTSQLDVCLIV